MQILIVDDHELIRSGLKDFLHKHLEQPDIREADCGKTALTLADTNAFDLAIVDLFMPGEQAFQFIRKLCDKHPDLPVLVLSASDSGAHIRKCVDLGASAFVNKSAPQTDLLKAINTALAGGLCFPSVQDTQAVVNPETSLPKLTADQVIHNLTDRQLEVLCMVAQGKSNKQIARECNLSDNTVKVHVSAILRSLELNNRTQIGLLGQQLGLIETGDSFGEAIATSASPQ